MGFGDVPDRTQEVVNTITLDASGATKSHVCFTVTGSVLVHGIWGVVTTTIGVNHTAGHLRTDDQTAQIVLSEAVTGVALSGLAVGTLVSKTALLAVALTLDSNAVGAITEPASAGQELLSPFIVVKKTGAVTTIDYRYTSSDTPTSGAIEWHALWEPLSSDGALT